MKKELCVENNITLILIDEFYTYTKFEDLKDIIVKQLPKKYIEIGDWSYRLDKNARIVTETNNSLQ